MIFVFEKDKREIHCYSEVDCLYLIGNKVHICNVVEEYSSEEMANKAFRTIRFRIGWGYEIARSEGSVAVHMPTEYELNNEKKQFENPLYTIAVYRISRDEESFRKYLKNLFDDILTEVDYIIQGDTVEDLEKELKDKPIWDGSFYTLFENLRYEDIASGEFHFGEIKKEIERFERKKKRTYCKWEQEKDVFHIKTNCSSDAISIGTDLLSKIKYCPCCGRKIKFIGEDQ